MKCSLCGSDENLVPPSNHDFDVVYHKEKGNYEPRVEITVRQNNGYGCCASCLGEFAKLAGILMSKRV